MTTTYGGIKNALRDSKNIGDTTRKFLKVLIKLGADKDIICVEVISDTDEKCVTVTWNNVAMVVDDEEVVSTQYEKKEGIEVPWTKGPLIIDHILSNSIAACTSKEAARFLFKMHHE